jgi:ATP-dependent DNA ligase
MNVLTMRREVVFRHACKLGFEGIVCKRKRSPYRSGRSVRRP